MRKIPKANYADSDELFLRIKTLELEAAKMPPGMGRQSVLIEAAKYRAYAEVKRWVGNEWCRPQLTQSANNKIASGES